MNTEPGKAPPQGMPDNGDRPPEDEGVLNPYAVLQHAMGKNPDGVTFFPLLPVIVDTVRQNDKRDARITIGTSDDVVKNITGKPEMVNLYMIVAVPRGMVNDYLELRDTRIIRPGSGIVSARS